MARKKNQIANYVISNMDKIVAHVIGLSDSELGIWTRKAITDLCNGCKDPNTDCLVREIYEKSQHLMLKKQNENSRYYRKCLARQGKTPQEPTADSLAASANEAGNPLTRESETRGPQTDNFNGDATTGDGVEVVYTRESGSLELTTISNISQDAPNGNAGDERRSGSNSAATVNLVHPAPIAESARCATSEAVKALADASTREDGEFKSDSGNAGNLESATSAKTFVTTTEATTPCTISADGPRQAEARQSRGTGSDSLRGTKQPESHSGKDSVLLPAEPKKPYGTCGHVMLTDAEGRTLRETYGKHLAIAIDILDAYGENNPKKFAKYKNHAAVLRKGNWVWNKVQEMILNEKRIENASKGPKNWKAQERERTARVLRGESADGSDIVRDEDLTPEELEAKYA